MTQETVPLFPWLETLKFIPLFVQGKDSKGKQYLQKKVRERARKQKRRKRNQERQSQWNKEGLRLLLETLCHFVCQPGESSVWGKRGLYVCVSVCLQLSLLFPFSKWWLSLRCFQLWICAQFTTLHTVQVSLCIPVRERPPISSHTETCVSQILKRLQQILLSLM